ncbi:MAG: hypothetical protein GX542_00820 [Rhodococcus sp.]|nr:hypothetical protein [Rhodococcus sp. (in: high G+C Gram-positive bacteria)]
MQPTQDAPIQENETTPPPPAPASKRGPLIVGGVLVAAVVAAGAGFAVFGGDDSESASGTNSAFAEADTPAERLAAAVEFTMADGPVTMTTTRDGVERTSLMDHANDIMYTEMPKNPMTGVSSTMFMRGDEILVQFAEDTPFAEGDQWYRVPASESQMAPNLTQNMDPEYARSFLDLAKDVKEAGTEQVDGVDATHFVATLDTRAFAEKSLEGMSAGQGSEGATPEMTEQAIDMMASMIPDTKDYWVDESGRILKESDGTQVVRYQGFGEPLDLPEIDEAAIKEMPNP